MVCRSTPLVARGWRKPARPHREQENAYSETHRNTSLFSLSYPRYQRLIADSDTDTITYGPLTSGMRDPHRSRAELRLSSSRPGLRAALIPSKPSNMLVHLAGWGSIGPHGPGTHAGFRSHVRCEHSGPPRPPSSDAHIRVRRAGGHTGCCRLRTQLPRGRQPSHQRRPSTGCGPSWPLPGRGTSRSSSSRTAGSSTPPAAASRPRRRRDTHCFAPSGWVTGSRSTPFGGGQPAISRRAAALRSHRCGATARRRRQLRQRRGLRHRTGTALRGAALR